MKKIILVGEDDDAIGDIITSILQSENYKVLLAKNEEEIKHHFQRASIDLIFLDIWLAGQDGSIIAKNIKIKQATKEIPLVLMSADNQTENIAKMVGADDFLLKPFSLDDLLKIARKYTK